jgi:hypothetical protein
MINKENVGELSHGMVTETSKSITAWSHSSQTGFLPFSLHISAPHIVIKLGDQEAIS